MDTSDNFIELDISKKSKKIRPDSSSPHNKHSRSENTKNSKWKRSKEGDNTIHKKDNWKGNTKEEWESLNHMIVFPFSQGMCCCMKKVFDSSFPIVFHSTNFYENSISDFL